MWSVWLVFCDCGLDSVCPLQDKDRRLMEASWWERQTVGDTGSCSGSFPMNQFFESGSQSIGVSGSASVLPMNIQDWFPLRWTGWISLLSKRLWSLFQHHSSKASVLQSSAFFIIQLSYSYMITGKTTALTRQTLVGRVMSLLFNMLSRLVIAFLPRSKCLFTSRLQSPL